MGTIHQPVLLNEVLAWLAPREGSILLDGTTGGGGHAAALARRVGATGRVIGLDRDPAMLDLAREAVGGLPVTLVRAAYAEMARVLEDLEIDHVQGVLLDLGLSSDQLAWEGRGFSFAADGPLDMRFDPDAGGPTAADLVNRLSAEELANLIYEFGEERFSRRIARRIVEARQAGAIRTTGQLADLVRRSLPGRARRGPIGDPATRVFQALADRRQRRARPARRRVAGHPGCPGPGRTGRDHQLPLAGGPPGQVGVQVRSAPVGVDQEARDGDRPGVGVKPPSP